MSPNALPQSRGVEERNPKTMQDQEQQPMSKPPKPQRNDTRAAEPATPSEPASTHSPVVPPTAPAEPTTAPATESNPHEWPEGWEPVSIESVGAWKGQGRIFVKPIGYTLSDSKTSLMRPDERVKPQAIIICQVRSKKGIAVQGFGLPADAAPIVAKPGEFISIWYRPGLRDLLRCGGIDVMLQDNGVQQTERGEMKKFHVVKRVGTRGEPLQLLEDKDFRVETRTMPLPWERQYRSDNNGDTDAIYGGGGNWVGDDDIPF